MTDRAVDTSVLTALSCSLPTGEAGRRRAEVGRLFAQAVRMIEVDSGVELEYDAEDATARALFDFVLFERTCCARLTYDLRFEPDSRATHLRITGPQELVASIRAWAGETCGRNSSSIVF